jgi:hypothetical protein
MITANLGKQTKVKKEEKSLLPHNDSMFNFKVERIEK